MLNDKELELQLQVVRKRLSTDLKSGNHHLNESLDYLAESSGKMLRPALLLTGSRFGRLYEKNIDELIKLATAIETLHIATLLHDDVIDDSKLRRGKESVQSKYSKEYAIYMGDYLLSRCFLMLTELQIPKELAVALAKVVSRICIGEMGQFKFRNSLALTPMGYLRNISGKTAALFAIALSAGSYITKSSRDVTKRLAHAGYQIGMAFQIIDDLLDYTGDENMVGKDLKSDLIKGYYTMPVIFALESENSNKTELTKILESGVTKDNIDSVIALIKGSGAIERTRKLALRYHDRAINVINPLPENSAKNMLLNLMPKLIERVN